jgi:hypothetical protein
MEIDHRTIKVVELHVDGDKALEKGTAHSVWGEYEYIHQYIYIERSYPKLVAAIHAVGGGK